MDWHGLGNVETREYIIEAGVIIALIIIRVYERRKRTKKSNANSKASNQTNKTIQKK